MGKGLPLCRIYGGTSSPPPSFQTGAGYLLPPESRKRREDGLLERHHSRQEHRHRDRLVVLRVREEGHLNICERYQAGVLGRGQRGQGRAHRGNGCTRPVCVYGVCFFFRGPLGLEVGLRSTPFRKRVLSNLSKKTKNPNPSPIGNRFGLYGFGAADGSRTRTPIRTQAPQACQSTNSSTAANCGHF